MGTLGARAALGGWQGRVRAFVPASQSAASLGSAVGMPGVFLCAQPHRRPVGEHFSTWRSSLCGPLEPT